MVPEAMTTMATGMATDTLWTLVMMQCRHRCAAKWMLGARQTQLHNFESGNVNLLAEQLVAKHLVAEHVEVMKCRFPSSTLCLKSKTLLQIS